LRQKYSPFGELVIKSSKATCNLVKGPGVKLAVQSGKFAARQAKSTMAWARTRVKEQGIGGNIGRVRYGSMKDRVFGKKKLFDD
jgi:hypothetical protein